MRTTRILLTFAGARDPFNRDQVIDGQQTDGPVLTVLRADRFDRVYVFTDERLAPNARDLAREIRSRHPRVRTELVEFQLADPTDYEAIFDQLHLHSRGILRRSPPDSALYFISIASGTPQMQTVWFLLAQSGLIPAVLLKVTPSRFLAHGQRSVSEIRLSLAEFPKITPGDIDPLEVASLRIQKERLEAEREAAFSEIEAEGIVGRSKAIQDAVATALRAAPTDYPVLILGETGTGKELFARLLHRRSRRSAGPFIPVNSASVPGTLFESELFGHERGAFTGAAMEKKGKFELADGGTLFLDEVGDLPLDLQAKLLRALQGEVQRIGGTKVTRVDVRVIAATNRDLKECVAAHTFREDLYYRLNVIPLHLPPLRERRDDIPLLAEHFMNGIVELAPSQKRRFSKRALKILVEHAWPGNIRQLENTIKQLVILSDGVLITEDDLPEDTRPRSFPGGAKPPTVLIPPEGMDVTRHLKNLEASYFRGAIEMTAGNEAAAARLLGIKPHTFRKRLRRRLSP